MKSFTKRETVRSRDPFNEIYVEVGSRVRELRRRRTLTQQQLANLVSFTRASITNIELGRQKILLHTLYDLARALDVTPTCLLPNVKDPTVDELGDFAEAYDGIGHEWVKKVTRKTIKGK